MATALAFFEGTAALLTGFTFTVTRALLGLRMARRLISVATFCTAMVACFRNSVVRLCLARLMVSTSFGLGIVEMPRKPRR